MTGKPVMVGLDDPNQNRFVPRPPVHDTMTVSLKWIVPLTSFLIVISQNEEKVSVLTLLVQSSPKLPEMLKFTPEK
jgi:hypothetical protein